MLFRSDPPVVISRKPVQGRGSDVEDRRGHRRRLVRSTAVFAGATGLSRGSG